jgi:hypothetical protein
LIDPTGVGTLGNKYCLSVVTNNRRNKMLDAFKTDNGKELKIYHVKNTALYKVAFTTGGELPAELQGMYTSPKFAQDAIEAYLAHKNKKTSVKKEQVSVQNAG